MNNRFIMYDERVDASEVYRFGRVTDCTKEKVTVLDAATSQGIEIKPEQIVLVSVRKGKRGRSDFVELICDLAMKELEEIVSGQ